MIDIVHKLDDVEHSVILLVNAVHFNAPWNKPFPISETANQDFFIDHERYKTTPFMSQIADFHYLELNDSDAKVLRLPHKVRFS